MTLRFFGMVAGSVLLLGVSAIAVHADETGTGSEAHYQGSIDNPRAEEATNLADDHVAVGDHGTTDIPSDGSHGWGGDDHPPLANATPELDSLILFAAGAAGTAGYALMRLRARAHTGTVTPS